MTRKILFQQLVKRETMGYDFHRQKPVDSFIADFFCSKLLLVIELDGYTHSFEKVFDRDKKKEQRLSEIGVTVLRYEDNDVMKNIEGVLEDIKRYIKRIENKHTP